MISVPFSFNMAFLFAVTVLFVIVVTAFWVLLCIPIPFVEASMIVISEFVIFTLPFVFSIPVSPEVFPIFTLEFVILTCEFLSADITVFSPWIVESIIFVLLSS